MPLKLFTNPFSRGLLAQWYLAELGLEYESVLVDFKSKPEALFRVNPAGKVPAIDDEGFPLAESGAVLYYLAEKHGRLPGDPQGRATILQWMFFGASEVGQIGVGAPEKSQAKLQEILGILEKALGAGEYVAGSDFSIADAMLSSSLMYLPLMMPTDYSPFPKVEGWLARIKARPACQQAMGPVFNAKPPAS